MSQEDGRERGVVQESQPDEENGNPYVQIAIGLVFLIGGLVAGFGVTFWITFGMSFAAAGLIGSGVSQIQRERRLEGRATQRSVEPSEADKERELLSVIRDKGTGITPAEAAMDTTLTVTEADGILSALAGKGHLLVESSDGALFYRLPSRSENRRLQG